MPIRIQRRRTRGWKMPPNTVYVGRPTKWASPFRIGPNMTAAKAVQAYARWLEMMPSLAADACRELRGRNLACWCRLDEPCHAGFLLRLVNE